MKLEYTCSACKKQNTYKSSAATRGDLQMEVGDEVRVHCASCGKDDIKHINRIQAVVDNRKLLLGLVIAIIISVVSFFFLRGWGFLIIGVPILLWYQEMNATKSFNNYKIRRR